MSPICPTPTITRHPHTTTRRLRAGRHVVALGVVALFGIIAACSGTGGVVRGDATSRLVIDLRNDGFEVSVAPDGDTPTTPRQIQFRPVSATTGASVPWRDLDATDGRGRVRGLADPGAYEFRFRGQDPATTWSAPVAKFFAPTTLPVVRIDTVDGEVPHATKRPPTPVTVTVEADGATALSAPAEIRGRGNTTWRHVKDKKSYQVTFDRSESPLELPASDTFVLLANFFDRSQMRTDTAMALARATDLAWTPDFRWVELVVDGDYRGIYQLGEKVDLAPDKVALRTPAKGITDGLAVTGDYLLQIGEAGTTDARHKAAWTTGLGVPLMIQRPRSAVDNDAQTAWVRDRIAHFEAALFSPEWRNPWSGYPALLDVDSFIDVWIVEELTVDLDAFISSTFLSIERGDPRLHFGPVWDFDVSLGSPFGYLSSNPAGWHTIHPDIAPNNVHRPWVMRLFSDPALVRRVEARWRELAPAFRTVAAGITERAAPLGPARTNDLARWRDARESRFGHRYGAILAEDEPEFIAGWLTVRIEWMGAELARLAAGQPIGERIPERLREGPTPGSPP